MDHWVYKPRQSDVTCKLQASILQGQQISFWHSPSQSFDLHIYRFTDFKNINWMIIRPATYKRLLEYTIKKDKVGFRQHFNKFRGILELPNETKNECWHKTDYLNVVLGFCKKYIAPSSGRFRRLLFPQATCLPVSAIPARHGRDRPGEAGTIKAASV